MYFLQNGILTSAYPYRLNVQNFSKCSANVNSVKILFRVNINALVRCWRNRNSEKTVHTEHAQNNVHFLMGRQWLDWSVQHMSMVHVVHTDAPSNLVWFNAVRTCVLTRCANSGHCACSTHAKCGPSTKRRHTWGPMLVLASDVDSSFSKTQELTIKLWGSLTPFLALKLFLESFYIWIKVRYWLKPHTF